MDSARQFEWIQRNRCKRDRVRQAGTLIQELTQSVEAGDYPARIAAAIAGVVDGEFRTHCRIATIDSASLVIHVDEASLVYLMRLRWLSVLSSALLANRAGRRVRRIIFRFGNVGAEIPNPDEQLLQGRVVG